MRRFGLMVFGLLLSGPAAAQDMPLDQILIPTEGWRPVPVELRSFGGMTTGPGGEVLVSDPEAGRILALTPDGPKEFPAGNGLACHGLCLGPAGKLYASDPDRRRVFILDPAGEAKARVLEVGVPARDLVVTRDGILFATVPEEKAIYRIDQEGRAMKATREFDGPAGLTLWPDEGTLVVGARGALMFAFRVEEDRQLTHWEGYYRLQTRPPQMDAEVRALTADRTSRVYAATREGVQVFDTLGRLCGVLTRPDRAPVAGVAFGGPERDLLFIVCGSKVYYRKTRARGVR